MADFITQYETYGSNQAIIATASETFFSSSTDLSNKSKYNSSFNYLEVTNDSPYKIYIDLDGLSTRRRVLFPQAALIIRADENIYFDNVLITNPDAVNQIDADLVKLNARIQKQVTQIVQLARR
jgi:hypothetical protein